MPRARLPASARRDEASWAWDKESWREGRSWLQSVVWGVTEPPRRGGLGTEPSLSELRKQLGRGGWSTWPELGQLPGKEAGAGDPGEALRRRPGRAGRARERSWPWERPLPSPPADCPRLPTGPSQGPQDGPAVLSPHRWGRPGTEPPGHSPGPPARKEHRRPGPRPRDWTLPPPRSLRVLQNLIKFPSTVFRGRAPGRRGPAEARACARQGELLAFSCFMFKVGISHCCPG